MRFSTIAFQPWSCLISFSLWVGGKMHDSSGSGKERAGVVSGSAVAGCRFSSCW